MTIEYFDKDRHLESLQAWRSAHGLSPIDPATLPAIGFIASDESDGVAIGFLRKVEGGYGHVDGLTSNPSKISAARNDALDLVSTAILATAKTLGMSGVVAMSKDESTITRSEKHGFAKLPHTYLVVNLNNWSG